MSAEQTPDIERVLAEHRLSNVVCTCMAWSASWGDDRPAIESDHRAHVAQALAPVLAAAVREALVEAADEITAARNRGGYVDHQTAAHIDRWLRDRADWVAEPQHEAATSGKESEASDE